jgi:hypothetical protein
MSIIPLKGMASGFALMLLLIPVIFQKHLMFCLYCKMFRERIYKGYVGILNDKEGSQELGNQG